MFEYNGLFTRKKSQINMSLVNRHSVLQVCVCVAKLCVTKLREEAEEEAEEAADGIQNQNKNPTQRCGEQVTRIDLMEKVLAVGG